VGISRHFSTTIFSFLGPLPGSFGRRGIGYRSRRGLLLGSERALVLLAHRSFMADKESDPAPSRRRSAGPLQIASAVFWGFFGVRKRRNLEEDVTTIKPLHIVIAGVVGAALFVLLLVLIVRAIIANA